jgi:hypothetical protein
MDGQHATYLYAVVPSATRLGALRGIGGDPITLLRHGPLAAIVGDAIADALVVTELSELGPVALAHDAVVRTAMEAADAVVPFRLGTVFRDRDAIRTYLADHVDALRAALDRVTRCREWGVTVRRPSRARPLAADDLARELGALAVAVATHHPRDGLLFDEAYLIRRDAEVAFLDAVDRCCDRLLVRGFALEVSGPWPVYSFTGAR